MQTFLRPGFAVAMAPDAALLVEAAAAWLCLLLQKLAATSSLAAASVSPPTPAYDNGHTISCLRRQRQRQRHQGAHMFLSVSKLGLHSHPCISQQRLHLKEIKEFGMLVLQELLDHLEGMLSNEAVEVSGGQSIVEVKPQVGAKLGPRCLSRDLAIPAGRFAALDASLSCQRPHAPVRCTS